MTHDDAAALDAAILEAHERYDLDLLVELYRQAADLKRFAGDMEACWFLTTHAYVFALEAGHPDAASLHEALKSVGRDE